MARFLIAAAFALVVALPASANAAEPQCGTEAPMFEAGGKFAGEVRQVIDGQTLCVGRAPHPDTWIRVRLSDLELRQPTSRRSRNALRRVALGNYAVCTVADQPYTASDPVPAVCRVAGVSVTGRVKRATGR